MSPIRPAAVIILAAGEGARMKSATPKVLHFLCGRTMLGHVLAASSALDPEQLIVVVGHGRDLLTAHLAEIASHARVAIQEQQHGTGHATRIALQTAGELDGLVVVSYGDTPLLTPQTLRQLISVHQQADNAVTMLSAIVPDPTGYGRVIRDRNGTVTGIVEERDATPEQRAIQEINSGIYAFDGKRLAGALPQLKTNNAQRQEYLTDVVGILDTDGHRVGAAPAPDYRDILGINDRVQLAEARRMLRDRLAAHWMREGVTFIDPATTWLDVDVTFEPDVTVHPHTQLMGHTHLASGAQVGPGCALTDTQVGEGAAVTHAVCVAAEIGPQATVGPFTYLRPGAKLGRKAKAGAYVEIKASEVGEGAKVPHLTYVGDAKIGEHTNIGAATVFVNYDGVSKHRTTIGSHARTGADNMFIAPVTVGDGAYTAAGSVITEDVPPGALGIARGEQRNVDGWVARKRPGTSAAQAAACAMAPGGVADAHQTGKAEFDDARRAGARGQPGEKEPER